MNKKNDSKTITPIQTGKPPDLRLLPTEGKHYTLEPVQGGDFDSRTQEFGRCQDLQRLFGLKRGSAYNLLNDGKIKGVLLRVRGQKSGVRLWDMASIRAYIRSQMYAATKEQKP